jgi:hypothetical protein
MKHPHQEPTHATQDAMPAYLRGQIKSLTEDARARYHSAIARLEELGRASPNADPIVLEHLLIESETQAIEASNTSKLLMRRIVSLRVATELPQPTQQPQG